REKGDSLAEGYISELWDFTRVSVTQHNLQELKEIWEQWNNEVRQLFYSNYGDLPYLLDMKVDKCLFRALAQFWNPAYSCFTFGKVDLVPTIEEYMALLRCSRIQVDRIYSKAVNIPTFLRKLVNITGMTHLDAKKRVDIFALSIYGLVVFHKALGHVDEAVTDLFDRLDKRVTPVSVILAETFRSLNACRRVGEGRFIGCAQLLLNLQEEDIEWRVPWLLPDKILYRCRDFDWVPLLGIWGAVGYAPLLVLRQYRLRQFVPATQGLAECEFSYKDDGYKNNVREITNAWNQTRQMKGLVVGPMTTSEYSEWWVKRINDNILGPSLENSQSIEEHLRVVPSELEIIKQNFEKRNVELEKKIEQIEEEKMNLRLDVDVQRLEADKLRKGKNKAEEELDSLKTDYKKLRLSMRTVGLGKTSEQWREEIREERNKSYWWERKFQEVQARNKALEKSLTESQKEKGKLKDRVVELEGSLHQHRSQNSVVELKASLSKIEEMKSKIEGLEAALRNCEIREVADHLQALAVQGDTLSVKYELESDRGQELALLLKKIR
ncbi:hypothetical protein Gotri_026681, partial [Gossypium trilobum]|nr:hypothetical protein [Gossypium trilobum]